MTTWPQDPAAGSAADDANAAGYHSLSALAAVALALGLLSAAALAAPVLLVIPVAAIGAGCLAMRRIAASDGALTGRGLAQAGVALGLAFAAATFVRTPVRDALIRRQTNAVGQQWLQLLASNRVDEALNLLSGQAISSLSPRSKDPAAPPPSPEDAMAAALERLKSAPVTNALKGLASPLVIRREREPVVPPVYDGGRLTDVAKFLVSPSNGGRPVRVELHLVRQSFYETEGRPWRVEYWKVLDNAAVDASGASRPT